MSICEEIFSSVRKLNPEKFELVKTFVDGVIVGQGGNSPTETASEFERQKDGTTKSHRPRVNSADRPASNGTRSVRQ